MSTSEVDKVIAWLIGSMCSVALFVSFTALV